MVSPDFRALAPDILYHFAAFFPQFLETHDLKGVGDDFFIIPTFFNKKTRTYQWIAIHPLMWDISPDSPGRKRLKRILEDLNIWKCANKKLWKDFQKELPQETALYSEAWQKIDGLCQETLDGIDDYTPYQRAVLMLYSGYQQHAEKNVEGLYYRWSRRCNNKHKYIHEPLSGYLTRGEVNTQEYNWFVFDDYDREWCSTECDFYTVCQCSDKSYLTTSNDCCCGGECVFERYQSLHDETVNHAEIKEEETPLVECGPYKTLMNDILLQGLLMEHLVSRSANGAEHVEEKHVIIAPIHDIGIGTERFGGIRGVLACYFSDRKSRESWYQEHWDDKGPLRMSRAISYLAREMGRASEIIAGTMEIKPPYDLVSHFLDSLIMVQDWEQAVVVCDDKPQYSFVRKEVENSFKRDWVLTSEHVPLPALVPVEEGSPIYETQKQNEKRRIRLFAKQIVLGEIRAGQFEGKKSRPTYQACPHPPVFKTDEVFYLWWPWELWSKELIPALQHQELIRHKGISICFQFPPYFVIPENLELQKAFANSYLRQQLELMRALVPKVRARQAALRSAVASIMGRNMSHNIGSHVLSYWIKREQKDQASRDLLSYLRNRMDFIAEIATTDQPAWSTTMLLCRDILTPFFRQTALLDYLGRSENVHFTPCNELGCGDVHEQHGLLSFEVYRGEEQIFGWRGWAEEYDRHTQETVKSAIPCCFDKSRVNGGQYVAYDVTNFPLPVSEDIPVTIPHSLTGLHAFYCILENFIRNSVKHGGKRAEFVMRIVVDDNDPDMLHLTLEDKEQRCSKETHCNIVRKLAEPLVDGRGELARSSWGLKEMKIAACYLRQGRSDLVDEMGNYQPAWLEKARERPYIYPRCMECNGEHITCNFGYSLYLLKPKDAAWLVKEKTLDIPGVEQVTAEEFNSRYSYYGLPHRLLFYDGKNPEIKKVVNDNSLLLPLRCVPKVPESGQLLFAGWLTSLLARQRKTGEKKTIKMVYRHMAPRSIQWEKRFNDCMATFEESATMPVLTEGERLILFDEHKECKKSSAMPRAEQCLYYQEVTGNRPSSKQLLTELERLQGDLQNLRFHELLESALTRVVVADERIWENYLDCREDLQGMGIFLVPVREKHLSLHELKELVEQQAPDFVIIHQGLLDKMEEKDRNEVFPFVEKSNAVLVVASGRGIPHTLIPGARFLEISTLETVLAEEDKFTLTQILYSLRRSDHA
jgi:hypothetical protein